MNVNFNGYGENVATFIADSALTEAGVPVKISADGTVAKCASGDLFCGICLGVRDGYATVQLSGYVRVNTSAKLASAFSSASFLRLLSPKAISPKKSPKIPAAR